jgi:hypothetical protein
MGWLGCHNQPAHARIVTATVAEWLYNLRASVLIPLRLGVTLYDIVELEADKLGRSS